MSEIKSIIKKGIAHLYDASEAEAIAKGYMQDKLSYLDSDETKENSSVSLPVFFDTDMKRLAAGTPLQYVTGVQHFAGLLFKVNEAVLIPRPETEELVAWVANDLKEQTAALTILDVGTGSGCIPIVLKLKCPMSTVYATDISKEAIQVARENALRHSVAINFVADSILNPSLLSLDGFDIIVSNPPYIPLSELNSLAINVSEYEPHLALFTPDENPILFYEAICNYAVRELKYNGLLYFEINPDYADAVADYLKKNGFTDLIFRNDLSGHLRFIKATHMIDK